MFKNDISGLISNNCFVASSGDLNTVSIQFIPQ